MALALEENFLTCYAFIHFNFNSLQEILNMDFFGNLTYNKQPMLLFFVKTTTFTQKESLCTCFLSHFAALSHIVGLWMTDCARCSTHGTSVTLSLVATCWSAHHQLPASSLVASLSTQQSALHQLSSARQSRPKNQHESSAR